MSNNIRHSGQNMQYLAWRLPKYPIDYSYLMNLLKDYNSPRDKISRMIKKKEIIQVKKGLYVQSPEFGNPINLKVLANLVWILNWYRELQRCIKRNLLRLFLIG